METNPTRDASQRRIELLERKLARLAASMRPRKDPPYHHVRRAICSFCEQTGVYRNVTRKNRLRDRPCVHCGKILGPGAHRRYLDDDYAAAADEFLHRQAQRVEVGSGRAARRSRPEKPGIKTSAGCGSSSRAAAPPTDRLCCSHAVDPGALWHCIKHGCRCGGFKKCEVRVGHSHA